MKVLKFGGSSVANAERITNIIKIALEKRKETPIAVVVSAFSGITDTLIEIASLAVNQDHKYLEIFEEIKNRHLKTAEELISKERINHVQNVIKITIQELEDLLHGISLIKELSAKSLDFIMSFGERLSAYIISEAVSTHGTTAEFLDARTLIKTNNEFGSAKVDFDATNKNIQKYFGEHRALQIITGFIGSTKENETTTLGRGGSDYSASIFGAALNAEEIEIWTDVNGVMTADPRKVKKAFSLKSLTYIEAMELSHFGAKVIHPPTMQPAMLKNIPLRIKNTFEPSHPGTIIGNEIFKHEHLIKGITSIKEIALLRLEGSGMFGVAGISKRLFGALAKEKISIILISQASSEHSICFAISPKESEKAKILIDEEFSSEIAGNLVNEILVEKDKSIIAVIGENMRHKSGIAGKVFSALGENAINISAIAQGSSELNISIVISQKDEIKALNVLHDSFFADKKTLNIFLVGTGLIGSTLLEQISHAKIPMKVIAIANSKKMHFNENGIDLQNWENLFDEDQNIEKFLEKMFELNLPNSIFVDCTSNQEIANTYEQILKNKIPIVTPNKKANSGPYSYYEKLKKAGADVRFLYETNVGAGLPILSTLHDLTITDDEIIKIEAVLSGTLSYIFNSFTGEKTFSEVVKEAKELGYTEPDPRDDLNGLDFARKMLILSRECGHKFELPDIQIENLLSEECLNAKTTEEFFIALEKSNPDWNEKRNSAAAENKKLCFIGKLENGKAEISLQAIDQNHPFFSLSGSDNIISFTTSRYHKNPLIVKGPGAGNEVTAAGVLADIIRIRQ